LRNIIFLGMISTILAGVHFYLFRRWVKAPGFSLPVRRIGAALFVILPIAMVASIRFSRTSTQDSVTLWAYLGFGYMGFLFFSLFTTLSSQLIIFITEKWTSSRVAKAGADDVAQPQRRALLAKGAAGISLLGSSALSARGLSEGSNPPRLNQIKVPIKGLREGLEGFRIVQLSDVHIGPTLRADFLTTIVRRVNALAPDLVAITGDLVDGSVAHLADHVRPLAGLKSRYGTFFTTGNHEYYSGADQWIAFLEQLDIKVLRNEHITLMHDQTPIDIIGVDDWRAGVFGGGHGHDLPKAVHNRQTDHTSILLAHQPKSIFEAADHQIDLVLSGHTHGGQLWPFRFMVMLVQPYLEGLYQHNERTSIFVHRGTGYWGVPMRLGVEAEIAELTLTRSLQV
jgi:uncharacterized protein